MAVVQWNPCHRTFLTFCNICNDARDGKIRQDMTMWPAVDLFESCTVAVTSCTVAVTCSYAHVLSLPQFSQETSELSFTELSSHLSILFLCSICSVQDGQAGNNVLRLRLDQSITANTPHYLRMTLGKPKGTSGGDGCTERGFILRRVPKKTPTQSIKVMKFFEKVENSAKYKMVFHRIFRLFLFFVVTNLDQRPAMRWRLFGVLVCCFQGPVLRQGAQLSLDHSQHRLQQVSHGQLS